MSATVTAPAVVHFEQEIVKMVTGTKKLLANSRDHTLLQTELTETAPGYIARLACGVHEVVVLVRQGNYLWSPELESAVRAEVATHLSPNAAPVRLKVVYV